jgi:hypothetical protein
MAPGARATRPMKRLLFAMAMIAACKTPVPPTPKEVPASSLTDLAGESLEAAVVIPADAPNGGIDFENNWLFERYGRFRRDAGGTGALNGRRYDVVKIELPDGEKKTVYFDITENWAHWSPQ